MRQRYPAIASLLLLLLVSGCMPTKPNPALDINSLFTGEEVAKKRAACLLDKGWDVELKEGGIISARIPWEQSTAYQADDDACLRESGVDPDAPLTDEQYKLIYAWYTAIGDCLSEAGWPSPRKPSFATFVTTYDSDPWIPWIEIRGSDLTQARKDCPVMDVPSQ